MNGSRLIALMHKVAHDSPHSIEQLCEEIYGPDKSHWTFRKELNPADDTARFPAERIQDFCRATRSIEPLVFIADGLGYRVVKYKVRAGEDITPPRLEPVAIFSAATRLLELEQAPDATRMEMVAAANAVIEEAEAAVYRRYPQSVAFKKGSRPGFWAKLFGRG